MLDKFRKGTRAVINKKEGNLLRERERERVRVKETAKEREKRGHLDSPVCCNSADREDRGDEYDVGDGEL